jgi:hypothetical protein
MKQLSWPLQAGGGEAAVTRYTYCARYKSVTVIRVGLPGYFVHVSITTPVVSALKNYYIQSFLEVPTGFFKYFWIQVAVSEVKRPLRNRFGTETVTNL